MGSLGGLMARSERMSNRKLRATGWAPRYPNVREGFRATVAELPAAEREKLAGRAPSTRAA